MDSRPALELKSSPLFERKIVDTQVVGRIWEDLLAHFVQDCHLNPTNELNKTHAAVTRLQCKN